MNKPELYRMFQCFLRENVDKINDDSVLILADALEEYGQPQSLKIANILRNTASFSVRRHKWDELCIGHFHPYEGPTTSFNAGPLAIPKGFLSYKTFLWNRIRLYMNYSDYNHGASVYLITRIHILLHDSLADMESAEKYLLSSADSFI